MSMIGIVLRVSEKELNDFIADSRLLEEFADAEDLEESGKQLYLDKSWDAINFLLTGHSLDTIELATPPLSNILFSGQLIDEEQDMGYGPAQYLTPSQVKEVSNALVNISSDDFRKRYDPKKLNDKDVYPQGWEEDENEKDYLTKSFEELKVFYSQAAQEGKAIVTYIS